MIVEVELRAFEETGTIRTVDLPEDLRDTEPARVLPWVWYFGQNEHQAKPVRSVSMGDIVRFGGRRWSIRAVGFEPVPDDYLPTLEDWLDGAWSGTSRG